MVRILIADDHVLVLEALCAILAKEYEIAGTAKNGRETVQKAVQLKPDMVIMDVSMPELNGIEAMRQIKASGCPAKIIFVTQQLESAYIRAAFDAGAMGYVAKQSASSELLLAARMAISGRYYVTPLATPKAGFDKGARVSRVNPAEMFGAGLTTRQREVLQLVAEGKTTKEVALTLKISPKTVEFHRNAIMDQLGLRTTAELTRYALSHGIIQ
ncbi:MAG TPA: response regulator transcription factor [Acidobacteriaceae bacterium]|nr:response regulator transcription factor [Acidobacteriaceae bacterium]